MLPYLFLFAYFAVLYACLWKLFVKAGRKAWEGFVPLYNLYVWNKLISKPWWWLLLLLVPGINLLMLIIMNVNTSIVFGERTLKQHVRMTFLPWMELPRLAYTEAPKYVGPIPVEQRKRGLVGQWGDAILFAVIVATVFRTFTFEAFTIPTPSMEKSLLVGDYLFVSKLSYGPRMPMTPITFPFTHHTIPVLNCQSFVTWFKQPYKRLPGFGKPERGDAVVFNFPEGDTVLKWFQNQSYYQLLREHDRKKVWDDNAKEENVVDGVRGMYNMGHVLVRPLDKKENYIKRCVAVAGDTLEVRDGYVYVNGVKEEFPEHAQFGYNTNLKVNDLNERSLKLLKDRYEIGMGDFGAPDENAQLNVALESAQLKKLEGNPYFSELKRQNHPHNHAPIERRRMIFPNHPDYHWSEDNFGPIVIPQAGATIALTLQNLPLYRRLITVYEHHTLEVKDGTILIDGQPATTYTFAQDCYWLMGDNRHRSQDARFWGFVPFDHVVGKAVLVWLTADPERGGFPRGIRWKRLFSKVR